jgi:phospholipid/cholesterol/gamma-HCH transport system substrate-binding protein
MGNKASSLGQIMTMALFALSVFAITLFLWLSFGGQIPLKPQQYRIKVPLTEGAQLVSEADVRISGVNVGRVKKETLDPGGARSLAELEIEEPYAPIPADTRAILRDKTLLGETYIELSPGDSNAETLPENATLPQAQVDEQVQFDEVLRIFDPETKQAFRQWMSGSADAFKGGAGEDVNNALGNLAPFTVDGADLFAVLDSERPQLAQFIRNTGEVFDALNGDGRDLRELIVNSNETFDALADEQRSLRETFAILPTFLDESRLTVNRLDRFARNTNPLVTRLKPVAADLPPTLRDLRALAPHLRELYVDLRPLIREAPRTLPQGARFVRGLVDEGVMEGLHTFLGEVNPLLSYINFAQLQLSTFLSNGAAGVNYRLGEHPDKGEFKGRPETQNGLGALGQFGAINEKTVRFNSTRRDPGNEGERGNAYVEPSAYNRQRAFGIVESWDCVPAGGQKRDPDENHPPCFVEPDSLFDGNKFPRLSRGERSDSPPVRSNEPCRDPRPPVSLLPGCVPPNRLSDLRLGGSPYWGR